jgi:hypothetical protein
MSAQRKLLFIKRKTEAEMSKINRRALFAGLAFTGISLASRARAEGEVCRSTDFASCMNLQIMVINFDPSNPLLVLVKEGKTSLHEAAHEVHRQVLTGNIARYQEEVPIWVYTWGTKNSGLERSSIYDNLVGTRNRRQAEVDSSEVALPYIKGRGTPKHKFKLIHRGQTVMFVPSKTFFTPESEILVCAPTLDSIVPSRARQEGVWITRGVLPSLLSQNTQPLSTFLMV